MNQSTNPNVGSWERKLYYLMDGPYRWRWRLDIPFRVALNLLVTAAALAAVFVAALACGGLGLALRELILSSR